MQEDLRPRGKNKAAAATQYEHLTDRRIAALAIPDKVTTIYDAKSSLGLKLMPTGKRFFFWYHSVRGVPTYRSIGEHPTISLDVARDKAREYDGALAVFKKEAYKGVNPFAKSDAASVLTLEKVAEMYIERHILLHARQPEKAAKEIRAALTRYLSSWKDRELSEISRADVLALHSRLGRGVGLTRKRKRASDLGKSTANHTMDTLRTIYKWAIDNELYAGKNPARLRTKERFVETERARCLSPEELARLLQACEQTREHNADLADFVRLSLATAQRKKTVMRARWSAINFDAQTWVLAASETKNGVALTIELSPTALRILSERRARLANRSPYVFPGKDPKTPRFDFNFQAWRSLLKLAQLDYPRSSPLNFRGHDLRHTAISFMVMAGRSLEQVGATVGHTSVRSTQRYAHLAQAVQRETMLAGERQMQKVIAAAQKQLPSS